MKPMSWQTAQALLEGTFISALTAAEKMFMHFAVLWINTRMHVYRTRIYAWYQAKVWNDFICAICHRHRVLAKESSISCVKCQLTSLLMWVLCIWLVCCGHYTTAFIRKFALLNADVCIVWMYSSKHSSSNVTLSMYAFWIYC